MDEVAVQNDVRLLKKSVSKASRAALTFSSVVASATALTRFLSAASC